MRGRLTCPALSPELRLLRHNRGDVKATKYKKPWRLIYFESFGNYKDARSKEKQIKSWHGGNAFKNFLAKAGRSSNGRTWAFEAQYLGSIPSLPALAGKKIKFGGVK